MLQSEGIFLCYIFNFQHIDLQRFLGYNTVISIVDIENEFDNGFKNVGYLFSSYLQTWLRNISSS